MRNGSTLASLITLIVLTAASWTLAQAPATAPSADGAAGGLAERLVAQAQELMERPQATAAHWYQAQAMLEEAVRLAPGEARFQQLLLETHLRLGDGAGALAVLGEYRKTQPDDRVAQLQFIDLQSQKMETADARIAYLSRIAAERSVAAEVRAYAAVLCANQLRAQARTEQSSAMLNRALELNPVDITALRTKYQWLTEQDPAQRVQILLALLRANPAQPAAMLELGNALASVGLHEAALQWLSRGATLAQRAGLPNIDLARNYAAELVLLDQLAPAAQMVDQLLAGNPNDVETWLLRLTIDQATGQEVPANRQKALVALSNRLASLRNAAGDTSATTRPVEAADVTFPDVSADVQRLADPSMAQLRQPYISTLSDWAWVELYFNRNPERAAPVVAQLRAILAEGSPLLARVEGFSELVSGRPDEARQKLSSGADRDPLAALGLLMLDRTTAQTDAALRAQKLLNGSGGGLLGALTYVALRDTGVKPTPQASAAAVSKELDQFPTGWLDVLENPQLFYALRVQPVKVGVGYGEPVLLTVTLQNLGKHDLTIGPDGLIQPAVTFDVQLRGAVEQYLPVVASARIFGQTLLRPGQSLSFVARVDQGKLGELLAASPSVAVPMFVTAVSNPLVTEQGALPGPGGQRVRMERLIERRGVSMADQSRQRVYATLVSGSPGEKLNALDLVAAWAKGSTDLRDEIVQVMSRAAADSSPSVAGYALYHMALLSEPEQRVKVISALLGRDLPAARILALQAAQSLEPSRLEALAGVLAQSDPSLSVRKFGAATVAALSSQTQPTTAPADPAR